MPRGSQTAAQKHQRNGKGSGARSLEDLPTLVYSSPAFQIRDERCRLPMGSPVLRDAIQSALRQSHGDTRAETCWVSRLSQFSGFYTALKEIDACLLGSWDRESVVQWNMRWFGNQD